MDIYMQNAIMTSDRFSEGRGYWLDRLDGIESICALPPSYDGGRKGAREELTHDLSLTVELSARLTRMCGGSQAGAYMIAAVTFQYLMSRFTGVSDVIVGMPLTCAQREWIGRSYLLALRTEVKEEDSFKRQLHQVKTAVAGAGKHAYIPFDRIAELLRMPPDRARLHVVVSMDGLHEDEAVTEARPDVRFRLRLDERGWTLGADYDGALYDADSMERLLRHAAQFLRSAADAPDAELRSLDIWDPADKQLLLGEPNAWDALHEVAFEEADIYERFERRANASPDAIAVIQDGAAVTYGELAARAALLSQTLLSRFAAGCTPKVAIIMERSPDLLVGLLAILRAGGAYVPISPEHPTERIAGVLEDSGASLLLTETGMTLPDGAADSVETLELTAHLCENAAGEEPAVRARRDDLAYVLYTSGTTGRPKGVMVTRGNMAFYVDAFLQEFGVDSRDTVLQQSAITFDTFVEEVFPALVSGASIVIARKSDLLDGGRLLRLLNEHRVTVVSTSPHVLNELNRQPAAESVRLYISGGDVLKGSYIDRLVLTATDVYNTYGPTETTVCTAYYKVVDTDAARDRIPIGSAIKGCRLYVLDKDGRLLPAGAVGELCISGPGVAAGYLNRPELTAERFVPDPHLPGAMMFRTGDFVRWLPERSLQFLGRLDDQVKIRGQRVELEEVERALLSCEPVRQAIVLTVGEPDAPVLRGYVIAERELHAGELRTYLSRLLPDYMVPAQFVQLSDIPLSSHGKIDRAALLRHEELMPTGIPYAAPRTATEAKLAALWSRLLEAERVGVDDDFFHLGGHSLLAIRMEVEAAKEEILVTASDVYDYSTVRDLAVLVDSRAGLAAAESATLAALAEPLPSSPAVVPMQKAAVYASVDCRIPNIEPYNELFFKTCFYNSLFPIVRHFGGSVLPFLSHHVNYYEADAETAIPVLGSIACESDETLLERMGIGYKALSRSEDVIVEITEEVGQGHPVIVWIDTYRASIRQDAYGKKHWAHTWLVNGFDRSRRTFTIMEHKHHDTLSYAERMVSFEELHDCYEGYLEYFQLECHTFFSFYKREQPGEISVVHDKNNIDYDKYIYVDNYMKCSEVVNKGIHYLQSYRSALAAALADAERMERDGAGMLLALNKLINAKKVEAYKSSRLFGEMSTTAALARSVVGEWSDLRADLAKGIYAGRIRSAAVDRMLAAFERAAVLEGDYSLHMLHM